MNLRADDRFVEDGGWHAAAGRCAAFLRRCRGKRVLFLELGVGWNTPGIIKYPFWRMTAENPDARYACVNYGQAVCPREIGDRAVCIDGDVGGVLAPLAGQNIRAAQYDRKNGSGDFLHFSGKIQILSARPPHKFLQGIPLPPKVAGGFSRLRKVNAVARTSSAPALDSGRKKHYNIV